MYRIEFEPGDVGVFRSIEEVATAIKSGVITSRARIYHQATDKWLPIEFHPHYRKALDMVASGNIPASTPSADPRSNGAPSTPPKAWAAVQVATAPAPVVEIAKEAPPTIRHSELEPPPASPFESEPLAGIMRAEPEPAVPGPVAAEPPQMSEPDETVETEPAPPPPDFVFTPRSPEIRFVPLEEPKPLGRARLAPSEYSLSPAFPGMHPNPELVADAVLNGLHIDTSASQSLFGQHSENETPGAAADSSANESLAPDPEGSARPMFRPRFRLAAVGNLRRPILIGVGGVALVVSAYFGLPAAANTLNAGVMSFGSGGLPFLDRESAAGLASESGPLNQAQAAGRLPRNPEPQGSPSFGASSAFPSRSPSDPRRQAAGSNAPPALAENQPRATAADSIVRAAPVAQIAVAAPKIAGLPGAANGKLSPAVLVARYEAAYAAAQAELETGFRTAGFANVFAPEHLRSAQGVRAARLSAGTASAYVAKYRRREAEIEAAYADSAEALAKTPADRKVWDSHKVLKESPEVAKLAGFLLEEIDSVLGVLTSQDGAYEIKDGAITFQDAAAAHAYSELRPWLERQAHQWADSADGPPSSAGRVLRAIGTTRLPEGGAF